MGLRGFRGMRLFSRNLPTREEIFSLGFSGGWLGGAGHGGDTVHGPPSGIWSYKS